MSNAPETHQCGFATIPDDDAGEAEDAAGVSYERLIISIAELCIIVLMAARSVNWWQNKIVLCSGDKGTFSGATASKWIRDLRNLRFDVLVMDTPPKGA